MMTIEEYRGMKMSHREEWEANFNGKRCSIEALDSIIIKKRGYGPEKPTYTNDANKPGHYYDPQGIHLHTWKNKKNIQNFKGEQNQNVKCIQITDDKPGYYCSICHVRNQNSTFKWVQSPEKTFDIPECLKKQRTDIYTDFEKLSVNDYIYFPPITSDDIDFGKLNITETRCIKNWTGLMFKVLHSIRFKKLEYKISNTKVLYLWPWELTPYQRFKLNFPDYKKSNVFLNTRNIFTENYSYII